MAAGDTKIVEVDEATEAAQAQEFVASLGVGKERSASRRSTPRTKVVDTTPKKISGPSGDDDTDYGDGEEDDADNSPVLESGSSDEAAEESEVSPPPKAAKAATPAPLSDEKLLPDDLAFKLIDFVLAPNEPMQKPDLAGASFRVNESRRKAQAAEERAAKAEQTLEALMQAVRTGKAPEAAPQAEEEIDFFADPPAAIGKAIQPHVQQIQDLREEIQGLKLEALRERTYQAEAKYAEKTPGYFETIKAYRENFFQELVQRFKGDEERALDLLQRSDAGVATLAQQWGEPPWVAFYDHAKRYLTGRGLPLPGVQAAASETPQAPQKPRTVRRDSSIAAARAATSSPSATTLSAGGRDRKSVV